MKNIRSTALALLCGIAVVGLACSGDPDAPSETASGASSSSDAGEARRRAPGFVFEDVTAASGIDFVHDNGAEGRHHYVETMGPGVALFDADGDGDLDLYVVDGGPLPGSQRAASARKPVNRLYRNDGSGKFSPVEDSGAEDDGYGMGVAVGDGDGDGRPDLYVLNYGPNAYFRNLGDGRFERVESGAEDPTWSVSGAFLDGDGDGDLDLYVANYLKYDVEVETPCKAGTLQIYCSPEQYPPTEDRYFENQGNGRFVDASRKAGVTGLGRGMGVAVADFDLDGRPDLYVTNDRSSNLFYRNRGGRFEEVAAQSGVGYSPTGAMEGGMGVVTGDFTGAGKTEIFLTNFQKEPNRLYTEAFEGFYDDMSLRSGLGFPSSEMVGWGIGAADFDGDGDLDLAVGNGHVFDNAEAFIPGSAFALADQLYVNDGTGRFEVKEFPGTPHSTRGIAVGDLDGDGDPDLVTAACGGPLQVWRNTTDAPDRFVTIELVGASGAPAYGARLSARVGDTVLRRQVHGGGSYASHGDPTVILGLGDAQRAEALEVVWPDGSTETADGLEGGRRIVWRQGEAITDRAR